MTIQFNFFATEQDELLIARETLSVLGTMYCLPARAILEDMVPRRIQDPDDLFSGKVGDQCYLFQEKDLSTVVVEPIPKGLYCVRFREFACLEYDPSRLAEDRVLHIGRFAYFYTGDEAFRRSVQKLFKKLRKHALKLPKTSSFWIFQTAAQETLSLAYSPTMIKPNPLYVGDGDAT